MLFAWLHRYPFFRLLGPLIVGIYCSDELICQGQSGWVASCVFPLFCSSLGILILSFFQKRYSRRWIFGVVLFLFCFVLGFMRMNRQMQAVEFAFGSEETTYRMFLVEEPQIKERNVFCRVLLTERIDSSYRKTTLNHKAIVYLSRDSLSECLGCGDELIAYTGFSTPANNGNPDEFDYARFLLRHQVSAIGNVHTGKWRRISQDAVHSFRQKAFDCRERVLAIYRHLGFQGDDFAVLSALTVGYKEGLSEEIRESFSVSGSSHVLALSGLHIGFLYALLWFCLRWLPGRWRAMAVLRTLLIIAFLWGFAFFTGLSASVVRSVFMFSLFALSGLSRRKNFSLNTLFAVAFFMLLCRPVWLFDVGFQLSFCAVTAILLLQPRIYRWFPGVHSRIGHYLCSLMSVSIAAQIGTAPLVLLYFSRFSTHFLLTNLLVIPLVSFIMYATVIMLLFTPYFPLQSIIAIGVKWLIGLLNFCVRWVEQLPWASFDGIWLYGTDVLGIYLFLFLLGYYLNTCKARNLILSVFCLLAVCTCHMVRQANDRPKPGFVFYNVRNCPAVHCLAADGHSWLIYADSIPDTSRLRKAVSGYWNRLHLEPPQAIITDYTGDMLAYRDHILSYSGQRICVVSDNRWRNKWAAQPLSIDYLYLCKGYDGCLKELLELFTVRTVILDASLSDRRRQAYGKECRQLDLLFISLPDEGSVSFML
ncbi:Competence protein [Bacteroides salyersiae]|uniref:ComEC/Rec2 family competence protein n=1 Tax=Bacteroides salyersiae TaxID=291644 RepID=UPI001B8D51E3|nr:ComEC/Rec2 family competence protein [Bacteroides salyersiae]QUT75046.1 Competence protein [Bacteroides salyersiae]